MMSRQTASAIFLGMLFVLIQPSGATAQSIFYQSATLGPPVDSGIGLNSFNYLGSRFSITSSVTVSAIGGHITNSAGLDYFGVIISFPGNVPVAGTNPFNGTGTTVLAEQNFVVSSSPSGDVIIPLSSPITLDPVSGTTYALVFGSGLFGATASGGMPGNNPDTPEGQNSFFHYNGSANNWFDAGFDEARFVVYTAAVPEPGTLALGAISMAGMAGMAVAYRRKRRRIKRRSKKQDGTVQTTLT